jgi:hypothetical protein
MIQHPKDDGTKEMETNQRYGTNEYIPTSTKYGSGNDENAKAREIRCDESDIGSQDAVSPDLTVHVGEKSECINHHEYTQNGRKPFLHFFRRIDLEQEKGCNNICNNVIYRQKPSDIIVQMPLSRM